VFVFQRQFFIFYQIQDLGDSVRNFEGKYVEKAFTVLESTSELFIKSDVTYYRALVRRFYGKTLKELLHLNICEGVEACYVCVMLRFRVKFGAL